MWLTQKFVNAYKSQLKEDYRLFYDDLAEYGNRDADIILYFIEGINGVPGQIRFILPSIIKKFGTGIYIRCCNLEEYSSSQLVWDKYTLENSIKKKDKIVEDLETYAKRHKRVIVMCSSNGFYDFLLAYQELERATINKCELAWVAVAPDHFEERYWSKYFYKLNGFVKNGFKWFAYPNSNYLKLFNPETTTNHDWSHNGKTHRFSKCDLEVRFRALGFLWSYASIECFGHILNYIRDKAEKKIDIKSYILVATADGYWNGKPIAEIEKQIDKYIIHKKIIYRDASHLWVLTPTNITALANLMDPLERTEL